MPFYQTNSIDDMYLYFICSCKNCVAFTMNYSKRFSLLILYTAIYAEECYNLVVAAYDPGHQQVQRAAGILIQSLLTKGDLVRVYKYISMYIWICVHLHT
jgi:hypothetical protein